MKLIKCNGSDVLAVGISGLEQQISLSATDALATSVGLMNLPTVRPIVTDK